MKKLVSLALAFAMIFCLFMVPANAITPTSVSIAVGGSELGFSDSVSYIKYNGTALEAGTKDDYNFAFDSSSSTVTVKDLNCDNSVAVKTTGDLNLYFTGTNNVICGDKSSESRFIIQDERNEESVGRLNFTLDGDGTLNVKGGDYSNINFRAYGGEFGPNITINGGTYNAQIMGGLGTLITINDGDIKLGFGISTTGRSIIVNGGSIETKFISDLGPSPLVINDGQVCVDSTGADESFLDFNGMTDYAACECNVEVNGGCFSAFGREGKLAIGESRTINLADGLAVIEPKDFDAKTSNYVIVAEKKLTDFSAKCLNLESTDTVDYWMNFEKITPNDADKGIIESALADGDKVAAFIDISMFKHEKGKAVEKLSVLDKDAIISMIVPEALREEGSTFYLLYTHKGGAAKKIVPDSYDTSTGELVFKAKEFSTYALIKSVPTAPVTEPEEIAQTRDNMRVAPYIVLLAVSAAGVVTFRKKVD